MCLLTLNLIAQNKVSGFVNNEEANSPINNIEILPPVKRDELIAYYQDADILFLHLNYLLWNPS